MDVEGYSARDSGRHSSREQYPRERDGGRHERGRDRDGYGHREKDRERDRDRGGRRRSRSPGHRGGRPPRRDAEQDGYTSSRAYREREREDRYSTREPERGWDRDRGAPRREPRRDFDDRPPRRDRERDGGRDLFEDRRGAPGGGRRDRDAFGGGGGGGPPGGRDRRRSASPPAKKREPTPDLTDVTPILDRKRRLTQWDIKPPGYENVTAEQAKLSGMFPLPGAPRQQSMDPSKLQAFINQPSGSATSDTLKPANSRQSRRLFVHNLPASATDESLLQFFNLQLNGLNVIEGADPCTLAQISDDRAFAMLEFRSASDATAATALDGTSMEASDAATNGANGSVKGLQLRRPKDYIVPTVTAEDSSYEAGTTSTYVPDTQNKILVANIPVYLNDQQVAELISAFGQLKGFILAKDRSTEESRGFAFCEYVDPATTDVAVENLNGMEVADQRIKVQRASIGIQQVLGSDLGVGAMAVLAGSKTNEMEESRVLQLLNMVTGDELINDEDFQDICEDVREEAVKYGTVVELKIPRPTTSTRQSSGVGKIFVKFDSTESAGKALRALAGRKFADRTVVATFFSEENFDVNAW